MNYDHVDVRIVKTKKVIKKSLFNIMIEEGIDAVTVKKLTDKAQINRGTFYRHYDNIESLIDDYYDDFIVELYHIFNRSVQEQKETSTKDNFSSYLILNVLEYIEKNFKIFELLWLTGKGKKYREKLSAFVKDILFYHEYALANKNDLPVPESYYLSYVISAFMGVIIKWIDDGCKEPSEEIAQILFTLQHNGIVIQSRNVQKCIDS